MSVLISIIVPVYNTEKYLTECMNALLNQTYENIEILLVDDGSKNACAKMCDSFASERVKVFHQKNAGVSAARNKGIDEASGEYICFVDSDDVVDKNFCQYMMKALDTEKVDVAACKYDVFVETYSKEVGFVGTKRILRNEKWSNVLNGESSIEGYLWNKIYSKKIIGDIRFDENLSMCEDQLFCFQVLNQTDDVVYVDAPLYHYRNNEAGVTKSLRPEQIEQAVRVGEHLVGIVTADADKQTVIGYKNNVAMWYYRLGWKYISYNVPHWGSKLKECRTAYKKYWTSLPATENAMSLFQIADNMIKFCFVNVPIVFIVFIKLLSIVKK